MQDHVHEAARQLPDIGELCERIIVAVYSNLLEKDGISLDGGANLGRHTFALAKLTGDGRVYAIEPLPPLLTILKQRAQRFHPTVKVIEAALSDYIGEAEFNYFCAPDSDHPDHPHWNAGLSGLRSSADRLALTHQIIRVNVTTIDDIFADLPNRLDFVKLDVEGAEYHAIKGGMRTLRATRPLIAFEDGGPGVGQTYGYDPRDFIDLWAAIGYELYDVLGERYTRANWLARDRWRPWYSFAVPIGWSKWTPTRDGIAAALKCFAIG